MKEKIIKKLIELNNKAISDDEVPVSCIITKENKIISYAYNSKIKNKSPLDHAEVIAIKKAAKKLKTWNLNDCELYVTLYPCDMCLSIINEARIKKVNYALNRTKKINNTVKIEKIETMEEPILEQQLKDFFKNKR